MSSKAWYRSKTIWVNTIAVVLAAAELQLHLLKEVLPGGLFAWLAFVLPVINAALRARSAAALTLRKPKLESTS